MGEIAILMAAGMGTRMRPLTEKTPKPLIKVHGKPMIETVIEGLRRRGVGKIYVVVGYLGNQFESLTDRYDDIEIIENKEYETVNNISSIFAVSKVLKNTEDDCFICEADLYVSDPGLFDCRLIKSCYFGKMVKGHSDDWVFDTDDSGRITRVGKCGDDRFNMVGIAYFMSKEARKLSEMIRNAYEKSGYHKLFWDEVVDQNLDELGLYVHEVKQGQITEIDTVEELAQIDAVYSDYSTEGKN